MSDDKFPIAYANLGAHMRVCLPKISPPMLSLVLAVRRYWKKTSGARRDRPELMAPLDYVRDGDTVVVWKLDRLARSLNQIIETVELMEARGIGFRSLTESIDTTTSGGKLIFHIFAALAEFECRVIRERTTAGLVAT